MNATSVWILMGFIGGLWGMGGTWLMQKFRHTSRTRFHLGLFFLSGSLVVLTAMMVGAS